MSDLEYFYDEDDFGMGAFGQPFPAEQESYIQGDGYTISLWKGRKIKELETSHLLNIEAMLIRHMKNAPAYLHSLYADKRTEVQAELATRKNELITKNEFRITADDIVALAKAKGVKIPKSGAGVYVGSKQIQEVVVRFDTTIKLKEKK